MAYSIRLPDGTLVENIPDSVTPEEAKRRIIAKYPEFGPKGESGFLPAFKAGVESLKGQAALTAGKLGLMGLPEAEKYQAEREAEAQRIYRPTEKSWTEAPFEKFKETLGGSLPYMAAPLAAAGATLALPAAAAAAPVVGGLTLGTLAAGTAAGLTSAAQFTGSNLARQLEEVKRTDPNAGLEQTSGATAFIAAVPQAALDVVSFRALPLVRNLFKSVGKELTEAEAKEIAKQGYKRVLADYAATGARTAGIEGVTETGQQFIERLQAGLKIADADARREYVDSFIGGAVLGGAISPVGRYFERGSEQARAETKIKQEVARRRAEEERGKVEAAELADRQRRAEEAGVPLFAADQRALDLAEAAVTGPQMQAPAPVVDRTQETQELQQDYARVSRAIEDYQKQIAQATQTGDVDAVAAMSQQLSPLIQGRKQIEEQLASINAVPDPMEALKALQAEEAKLLKNMQKQAELGESQKAGELAQKIKTLRAERQRLEAQAPQVGGEQLFMETPAGFAYPEATRRAERTAEEVDTGYQAELPPVKTAETLEGRMAERQEKMRGEEARAAEEQARRDVKQLAKLMMGSAETEDIALQRVERSLDSPVSLRALGLTKPEERAQYMDAVRTGELSPLVKKSLGLQSIDQIEARIAQEREKLQSYLAEDKQLVTPDNTFTPDGLKAFATQVRINELDTLKRNQPEKRVEDLGAPAEELLVRGDDALRIAKLQKERDAAVKQSQEAKTALDALTAQPEASEEQLAAAQQRYDTALQTVTQRDTEIEQIKAKVKVGGAKARESIKDAQSRQDQEFSNFASALDELRQTKLGQTERGYRYYVSSMAEEAAARGQEYMMPTFEQFKKDSLAKRKDALQQAVTYRNNYITNTIDEIDAARRAEGVRGVTPEERNALTKQLAKKMDELMIRAQEYDPVTRKVSEILVEPAVMRQGKVIRSARYEKVVEESRRPQELPRFTPSKNITREQLAFDMKAGTQAARPFARALFVTQEELAEIRDKALAREARPARSFIPGEQFTLPGIEPAPRKAAVAAEEKEEVPAAPEVGGAQRELFPEKLLEPRATIRKTPEAFMRFLGSLKVSNMRKQLDDAKRKIETVVEDRKVADATSEKNLDRLITEIGKDVAKTAAQVQQDAIKRINAEGLKDLQTIAQAVSQELAAKTKQYKSIVEKANRAEYYIPDKDRAAADAYLADLRSDLEALRNEIKEASPATEDKLLANAEVAVNKRLQAEIKLLKSLQAEKETRVAERKAAQPQAIARRNIAILETTQRRIADLRAKTKEAEVGVKVGLGLPGTKVERKDVVVETDEDTIELKKKYDREVKNIRSQLSKLKKQVEKGEQDKVGPATSKMAALYGKMEALRQDLAILQDQPVQRLDVQPITAAPFNLEALEKAQLGRVQEATEKEKQKYEQRIQDIDKQIAEAKGAQRARLGKTKKLLLEQKEIFEATGGNVDLQALELAQALENARMGTVRADKSIPRISEEQLAAQVGVYKNEIKAIDKALAAKGKKTKIEGPLRDTLITAKDNRLEAIKEIQTLINASNERIAAIIDENFNKPKGTPKTRATEAAKLQYEIDAMSYSAPDVKKAAKDYGFKSAEYARALRDARRNAMAHMSELENVPQAQSVRAYFERKGILKSRGQVENPTTVAEVRKVIQGAFPLVTDWDNKNVYVYPDVKSLGKNIGEYYNVPTDARGFVTPYGEVYLIASNIPKGQELAVFLHEVGAHVGFRNMLGDAQYKALVNQVETWAKRGDGSQESKIAKAAMQRVNYAFADETPDVETRDDEILAYFVEEAVIAGVNPTEKGKGPVAGFLYRLYENFKKIIGKLLGPDFAKQIKNMTAQDFVDFAYGAADFELRGEWHGTGVTFQEFDHSYMGTGEGMQAYMWGTYTATRPGTALSYARQELEKKIARTPEIKFDKETGVKFNGKTRAELSAIRDKAFDNWLNTLSVENRERRNKSNVISEIADEISDYIALAVKFGKEYKRKDLYDALISNDKTELVNALFRELKERSSITTYNNISFKELYNILKDFSFEYEVIQNKPVTYLKRVIRERKEDEYWELEKPLSEQSKHVQNSFDALLNDLANPEDAAMLKELLDKENNRLFAANLFPAYLYAQQPLFGSASKSSTSDRKKLIIASAKDPYFREGAAHTQLQKATAELLWSYGIAGNKHQGAKAANYVNFYDKNQQILTAAEVSDLKEGVKDVLGTKGTTPKVLFSVNYPADMPANVADTVQRITGAEQGVVERLKNTLRGGEFRARFVDRLDPLEQVLKYAKDNELAQAQQMFEAVYYSRMHDQRMNFTSAVVNHGGMKMVQRPKADGSMEFIPEAGFGVSLREISESLRESGIDADAANRLFTTYMAHQRAKNNPSVGLRKLNFNTDPAKGGISVDMLKDVDAYINSKPEIKDAFEKARTQYNEYNKNLINFLEATGAISKDLAKTLNATKDYIPFYRVDEKKEQVFLSIGTEDVPINIGSLKEQPYLRELVGGNEHIVDFFTSSVQNTTILTDMALRNLASSRVATSLKALGFAEIKPDAKPEGPNVVRFKVNGETQSAVLSEEKLDELGIDASILVKGLEGVSMTLPFMARMFTGPAQVLRKFVTRNPVYMLRQIVRDTSAAALVTGADITPVYSAIKQFPSMVKGTSNVEEILKKRGVFGGQTITGSSEDMAKLLRDLAKGGKTLNFQLARLDELSMKADAATRMTLYEDFRAKGMSEMEATLGALESMNFGRRGYSPTAYMLSMLVPFMNAQIQGLDVVYRAFTGKMYGQDQLNVRKKLMTRGAMLAATAIAYAMLMQDDEAYQNAPADEKYNNFFVYIPGVSEPLRVPIPFELGYIFKSLPEMVYNMATTDETLQKNIPALKSMVVNSIPIGLPQFIKPALEVAVNYSFFGGRAIESERELDLTKAERVRQNTTEVSKLLSKMTTVTVGSKEYGLSPIEIDHLMRGYFGGLVPALMSVANPVLEEPTKVKPETRASGTILIGGLFQPKDATGLINFAYEQVYDIQQRQRTLKELEATGREADADIFYKENEYLLDLTKDAGRFKKKMGDLAKEERIVREDPGMTPAQKRKELDEIRAERIAFAKDMIAAVSENKRLAAR
jgi:hypothetical protein